MLLYMESNTDEDGNGDSPVPWGVRSAMLYNGIMLTVEN